MADLMDQYDSVESAHPFFEPSNNPFQDEPVSILHNY